MKRIAILLAMIMLLGCGFVFVSCGDDESGTEELSAEDKAIQAVEFEIRAEVIKLSTFDGKDYTFSSFTQSSVSEISGGYSIRGTAFIKNGAGKTLSASYSAIVEYDAEYDDYDVDLSLNSFR